MSILLGAAMAAALASGQDITAQRVAPRGSYVQSCSESYVHQGRLYADCRDRSRQVRGTSIALAQCSNADIANDDGLLVCGRVRGDYEDRGNGRPGNGNGNGGGGRSSIVVYDDSNYRGASREFTSEDRNLGNTPFNDRISSIRVRGRWEICTDAQFGGRCRIIDGDVRNLNSTGFNDSISSIRPVRGGGRY
ncbi:beta/gamma crystallin-related protein [Brevundimonas sp. SL130]|uniref:beta/gamma crystallin-related protein n=1 Tax=Brevundimonas sp. SL130 TaxID=2995143 RepID=UPI00226CD71D|nr:beta/gamma crystallin-related protein [Brevundimonas sp. SL130]WAC61081.1 beta/gamma crystallin-related protein [Brevundimonas sp. SL130]